MLKGKYHDRIILNSITTSGSSWQSNHIVKSCDLLTAMLFKNEPDYHGVLFLAIGSGDRSWDMADKEATDDATKLHKEICRFELSKEQLHYVDQAGNKSDTPTNRLQVTYSVQLESISGLTEKNMVQLREFGLFGGNATTSKDSGQMIDYVIHPRIDLTPGITLIRVIELDFSSAGNTTSDTVPKQPPFISGGNGKLVSLPLRAIDGIGSKYEGELSKAGITTIKDLAEIDPATYKGTIPLARMNEFRSKATFSTRIIVDTKTLAPYATMSVDTFIKDETISEKFERSVATRQIRKQQLELSLLESSFNTNMLKTLLIGDILPD